MFCFNLNQLFFFFLVFLPLLFQSFFPTMTKIVGTLGPKSRSVELISACLRAGMSGMVGFFSNFLFSLVGNAFELFSRE